MIVPVLFQVNVYKSLFNLYVCLLSIPLFKDELCFDSIKLARTRNEPVTTFLLEVNSNYILTVLWRNQVKQVRFLVTRQVVEVFPTKCVICKLGIEIYGFTINSLNRSPRAEAI